MSEPTSSAPVPKPLTRNLGVNPKKLSQEILNSEHPESIARSLPAQTIYMAITARGLESSGELLEVISTNQRRLVLDFDLWNKDSISEDKIWEWLAITDTTDSLELLQLLLKAIDLKIVGWMICKYVDARTSEEPTDTPPGPGFNTPDKGFSWIQINHEDSDKRFLMSRFLALIFETNTDLFYQLLSIPGVSSESGLEEEAYGDRVRRLTGEGIPDSSIAAELHALLPDNILKHAILAGSGPGVYGGVEVVAPLVYSTASVQPLSSVIDGRSDYEAIESELTQIMNAAIVVFRIDFSDIDGVGLLAQKVRGAINVGLERSMKLTGLSPEAIFAILGVKMLYRAGLTILFKYQKLARTTAKTATPGALDSPALSLLDAVSAPFPVLPEFISATGEVVASADGKLAPGTRPVQHLVEIEKALAAVATPSKRVS